VDGRDVVREDGVARLVPGHDARGAFANLCECQFDVSGLKQYGGMFHGKYFTPKRLDFRGLQNCMNQFVDRA
jgi:hypothetical protein